MNTIKTRMKDFLISDAGPTVTEYAVMLAMIILGVMGVIAMMGAQMSDTFTSLESELPTTEFNITS